MVALFALLALTAGLSLAPVQGVTWFVDDDAVGPGSGTAADPFDTIQRAIDAPRVLSGHRILVLPGTYRETLVLTRKALEIEGRDGAAATFVDAEGRGCALHITDVPQGQVVVRGLTLRNGDALVVPGCAPFSCLGGGVRVQAAAVLLSDCSLVRNRANIGGGLAAIPRSVGDGTLVVVERSRFDGNHARSSGGAIASSFAPIYVTDSRFDGNDAVDVGGAIHSERPADVEVVGGSFDANHCGPFTSYGGAVSGGVYRGVRFVGNHARWGGAASHATLVECELIGNRAQHGGGASDSTLVGCVVCGNAAYRGAGVNFATVEACALEDNHGEIGGGAFASTLTRSVLRGNTATVGGGSYLGSLVRCTVTRNVATESGGGVFAAAGSALATIDSCILAHNLPEEVAPSSATVHVDWSLLAGPWSGGGVGTIQGDPGFWQPESGDLRLVRSSPAIDLGDPSLPLDPDGTRADAGALVYDAHACGVPATFCTGTLGSTLTLELSRDSGPAGGLDFGLSGAVPGGFVVVLAAAAPAVNVSLGVCLGPAASALFFASADQLGNVTMTLDAATLAGLGHPLGALRYFQAWQRDPTAPTGRAASSAIEWRLCR